MLNASKYLAVPYSVRRIELNFCSLYQQTALFAELFQARSAITKLYIERTLDAHPPQTLHGRWVKIAKLKAVCQQLT